MKILFDESWPAIDSNDELKEFQLEHKKYDPAYICQAVCMGRRDIKKWIEELWAGVNNYLDRDFQSKFKREFGRRGWELYLGATLLERGFKLGEDHQTSAPDFHIVGPRGQVWIEATAPLKGSGNDRVPEFAYQGPQSVPDSEMSLRFVQAFTTKVEQYRSFLQVGTVRQEEPYVIAVNTGELGHPEYMLAIRCLFGLGFPGISIQIDTATGGQVGDPESAWQERFKITKKSGEDVGTALFLDPANIGISAVIHCSQNIINCPHAPDLGSNFVVIHNPNATNPLPRDYFEFGEVWVGQDGSMIRVRES